MPGPNKVVLMVDQAERRLTDVFKALADPHRRTMLRRLAHGPCSPTELTRPLHMTLQGVIKHLRVLEHAHLIRLHKTGRKLVASPEPQTLRAAGQSIDHIRDGWESRPPGTIPGPAH